MDKDRETGTHEPNLYAAQNASVAPGTVRCIYGSTVQRYAEHHGMRDWCDKHCVDGIVRGTACYAKLMEAGIDPGNGEEICAKKIGPRADGPEEGLCG